MHFSLGPYEPVSNCVLTSWFLIVLLQESLTTGLNQTYLQELRRNLRFFIYLHQECLTKNHNLWHKQLEIIN